MCRAAPGRAGYRVKVSGLPVAGWVALPPRKIWLVVAGWPPMFRVKVILATVVLVVKLNPVTVPERAGRR